MQNRAHFT